MLKALDNEIILVDSLKMDSIKSKDAAVVVKAIGKNKEFSGLSLNKKTSAVIVLSERDEKTEKSFRNLKNIQLDLVKNINMIDLLNSKYLIIENPEKSFEILSNRVVIGKK